MTHDALILVGGKGTRLASVVADVAKPMAQVDGRPFVDVIVKSLQKQGVNRIFMATGHKADSVYDYYKDNASVVCIKENEPMGTGGAVLHAIHNIPDLSDRFYVLNGDSFYPFVLDDFENAPEAAVLLGAVEMDDSGRYGTLETGDENRIVRFVEKTGLNVAGLVSAGVYLLQKSYFAKLPLQACSIEQDIFPALAESGELLAVRNAGPMLDIGLPETYSAASEFLKRLDL